MVMLQFHGAVFVTLASTFFFSCEDSMPGFKNGFYPTCFNEAKLSCMINSENKCYPSVAERIWD